MLLLLYLILTLFCCKLRMMWWDVDNIMKRFCNVLQCFFFSYFLPTQSLIKKSSIIHFSLLFPFTLFSIIFFFFFFLFLTQYSKSIRISFFKRYYSVLLWAKYFLFSSMAIFLLNIFFYFATLLLLLIWIARCG